MHYCDFFYSIIHLMTIRGGRQRLPLHCQTLWFIPNLRSLWALSIPCGIRSAGKIIPLESLKHENLQEFQVISFELISLKLHCCYGSLLRHWKG